MKKLLLILFMTLFIGCKQSNIDPKIKQDISVFSDGNFLIKTTIRYDKGRQFVLGELFYINTEIVEYNDIEEIRKTEYNKAQIVSSQLKEFYEN